MMRPTSGQKDVFWQTFFCLWGLAVALTLASAAFSRLSPAQISRQLLIPIHTTETRLVYALIAQVSIYLAIYVGAGLVVARKVGLGAPLLERWFRHEPIRPTLRSTVVPIAVAVVVILAAYALASIPWLSPHKPQDLRAIEEVARSAEADKADAELVRLGLEGSHPISRLTVEVGRLDRAVESGLETQLFEVSVVVFLLLQLCGRRRSTEEGRLLWIAILIVALLRTVQSVVVLRENTALVTDIYRKYGLPHTIGPVWPTALRTSLRAIPTVGALSLLYVREGIEASILANYCAAVLYSLLTLFWFTHFR